ncbi:tyrosine-protein phosphatase [Candidatus Obscuribacterales bacterium]|nr:tyrosine-protein phosphatase [Candidatus Obscuribacterales bacterium]
MQFGKPYRPMLISVILALVGVFAAFYEHTSLRSTTRNLALTDPPEAREIPNFEAVSSYLYRGALPTPWGMEWLKQHGVKTIVDLREANTPPVIGEQITARAMGFNYINMPVRNLPTSEQLVAFKHIVENARDGAGPVFVHCNYGSDRTGFFIFTWRVAGERWRWSLALCEMLERGFFFHKFAENKTAPLADPRNW